MVEKGGRPKEEGEQKERRKEITDKRMKRREKEAYGRRRRKRTSTVEGGTAGRIKGRRRSRKMITGEGDERK